MHHLRFHLHQLRRHWLELSLAPMIRWWMGVRACGSFDGIEIVDMSLRRDVDDRFAKDTLEVLNLIKSVDPRRFRRIKREVKFIANGDSWRFASYGRPLRSCEFDYDRLKPSEDHDWDLWVYAAILVHEATHGAIYSRHIGYTEHLRSRIERLCHAEQSRFAKKADREDRLWSLHLVEPFDEKNWHSSWDMNIFSALKKFFARKREVLESLSKK